MGKMATDNSKELFQKLYTEFGYCGGSIEIQIPDEKWELNLKLLHVEGNRRYMQIGLFLQSEEALIVAPAFECEVVMNNDDEINSIEIVSFQNNFAGIEYYIDEDDILYMDYEKFAQDYLGLEMRFDDFMNKSMHYINQEKIIKYETVM